MIRLCSTAQCWVRSCHFRPPKANMWPSISITHTALQEQLRNTGIPFHCSTLVTGTHLECFENGAVVFYTTDTSLLRFSLHKSLFWRAWDQGIKQEVNLDALSVCYVLLTYPTVIHSFSLCGHENLSHLYASLGLWPEAKHSKQTNVFSRHSVSHQYSEPHDTE